MMHDMTRYSYLVDELSSELLYWAVSRGVSHDDAQDCLQNTRISVFQSEHKLDEAKNIKSYIFQTFVNKVRDLKRKHNRSSFTECSFSQIPDLENDEFGDAILGLASTDGGSQADGVQFALELGDIFEKSKDKAAFLSILGESSAGISKNRVFRERARQRKFVENYRKVGSFDF